MRLAIVGASARAATASALAVGHQVVAADLFADADLAARCRATKVDSWPDGLADWLARQQVDGWLYTGGLENHPQLVDQMAAVRRLFGNPSAVLTDVAKLQDVAADLAAVGCPVPTVLETAPAGAGEPAWLTKVPGTTGGLGVAEWTGQPPADAGVYWQRRIEGRSISAAYVAAGGLAKCLGVTEQLIGRVWSGARRFQYSGSVGPLWLPAATQHAVFRAGDFLARRAALTGLFGVDFVVDGAGVPWTVDVNPRFTASMELVERVSGTSAVGLHLSACTGQLPKGLPVPATGRYHGKAYLFARRNLVAGRLPPGDLADVPVEGTAIGRGQPICTLFAEANRFDQVEPRLQRRVAELEAHIDRHWYTASDKP